MKVPGCISILAAFYAAGSAFASTAIPARRPGPPVLLQGGDVFPVSGPVMLGTDLLLNNGIVAQIGRHLHAPPSVRVVDVTGLRVYPGLVSASTTLGLEEINAVPAMIDSAEIGAVNPNARAQLAINPESELIPVTRANGVLTARTSPSGRSSERAALGLLAGISTLLRLDGWTWEDMTLRAAAGIDLYWPAEPADWKEGLARHAAVVRQNGESLGILRKTFADARAYMRSKNASQSGDLAVDLRLEALLPVLRRDLPVFVHASTVNQIAAALEWARVENIRMILVGAHDAWRVADQIKEAGVSVIVGGAFVLPSRRDDGYDDVYSNAARLHTAGVRFCIASSGGEIGGYSNTRNLPYEAGMAAAFGLPVEEALKAITLYPAQILGVGAELGSIEHGKRATLIVTDGDPLEVPTQVKMAFIDGAMIDLGNRQVQLHEKYKRRYAE